MLPTGQKDRDRMNLQRARKLAEYADWEFELCSPIILLVHV